MRTTILICASLMAAAYFLQPFLEGRADRAAFEHYQLTADQEDLFDICKAAPSLNGKGFPATRASARECACIIANTGPETHERLKRVWAFSSRPTNQPEKVPSFKDVADRMPADGTSDNDDLMRDVKTFAEAMSVVSTCAL